MGMAGGAGACGGRENPAPVVSIAPSPDAGKARCHAHGEWGALPTNFDVENIAKTLGTTAAAVRARAGRLEAEVCAAAGVTPSEVRRLAWTASAWRQARAAAA